MICEKIFAEVERSVTRIVLMKIGSHGQNPGMIKKNIDEFKNKVYNICMFKSKDGTSNYSEISRERSIWWKLLI